MFSAVDGQQESHEKQEGRKSGCGDAFACSLGAVLSDYVTFSLLFWPSLRSGLVSFASFLGTHPLSCGVNAQSKRSLYLTLHQTYADVACSQHRCSVNANAPKLVSKLRLTELLQIRDCIGAM